VECAADERFCGACGTDIAGGLDALSQELNTRIENAVALGAAHRYGAAVAALYEVAELSDPRLACYARRAREEIAKVECDRQTHARAAEDGLVQARRFLESHSYESAQNAIEEVPQPMRTAEHHEILERVKAARHQVLTLGGEIRQAVQRKETRDLLPKLERLLVLKPNHAQARELAESLRDDLLRAAKAKFAQHQYREALDTLEQIPSFVRSTEVISLDEAARELHTLLVAIRQAPLADRQILGLAERLCKLAPQNPDAARLRQQVAERIKSSPTDPRLGSPEWSPAPKRTILGVPVDWLAHLTRNERANSDVAQALAEHPGQFFPALGLALQGLGLAAIEADLTPQDKVSVRSLLPALSLARRQANEVWGLDLGDYALKAIKLSRQGKTDVRIEACKYLLHSKPLSYPDAGQERAEVAEETLRAFSSAAGDLKGVKVCLGFAGPRVLGRFFELPPMPAKKVSDAIQYEAAHQFPIDPAELCWSHQILDEVAGPAADRQPRRLFLQAARDAQVRERVALCKSAGIAASCVQSDCVALHNAIVYELLADADPAETIATIDVGTDATNVVVSSRRSVWFRTFTQGGASFTRELVKQLNVTHDQAEQLLREPARARRYCQLEAALQPLIVQLAGEVERSLAAYSRHSADRPVRQIYCLGGGFQVPGLHRFLRGGK
jgi:Tfp pilus assembly PilM family ATPase